MNVLIVAHAAIRESNRDVYRRLAKRGHDVTVVVPHSWRSVLGGRLLPDREPKESPLRVVARYRFGRAHTSLFIYPGGLTGLIRRDAPTAIYIDQDPAGFCAFQVALAARVRPVGIVVTSAQNIVKKYPPPFNYFQRYVFSKSKVALALSQDCDRAIRARGFVGTVRIYNFGYDLVPLSDDRRNAIRSRYGFESPAVGFVGRLVEEKGVDSFLRALAMLDGVTGVVGGDGPERAALRVLAAELGVSSRVVFTGNLSPSEALDLIGALDVCVLPSRTRANWKEQFGRVLIEAMAQEVAVVGSSSGEIPATIDSAGIVFEEGNAIDLADAIRRALDPTTNRELIRKGALRVRDHFSLEAVTTVLEDALRLSLA